MYLTKINTGDVAIEKDRGQKDRWEFYKDRRDKWRWRRVTPRNEMIGASPRGFSNRRQCEKNAARNGCSL